MRRLNVPHRLVVRGVLAGCALLALAGFMGVHYVHVVARAAENRSLKEENIELKYQLGRVREEIARVDGTLQRIDQLSAKIENITRLNDPDRNLAMGPLSDKPGTGIPEVLYAEGEHTDYEYELLDSRMALRMIDSKLDDVESESVKAETSLRELTEYFWAEPSLLATTPSIRPTRSKLLTSTFGERTDPYTNHRVMHKGVDFAADYGSDVIAPADGLVIFVGARGNYGESVVIDHGYGVQTHYAHLSAAKIEVGQMVRRGQLIAQVGNTGRSTGAHLHYEVRFNGIPQDPERFVLD